MFIHLQIVFFFFFACFFFPRDSPNPIKILVTRLGSNVAIREENQNNSQINPCYLNQQASWCSGNTVDHSPFGNDLLDLKSDWKISRPTGSCAPRWKGHELNHLVYIECGPTPNNIDHQDYYTFKIGDSYKLFICHWHPGRTHPTYTTITYEQWSRLCRVVLSAQNVCAYNITSWLVNIPTL